MTTEEYKTQVLETRQQWASGLFFRLEPGKMGGVTLFPMPVFSHWTQNTVDTEAHTCLAVDACGRILGFQTDPVRLCRYDPKTHQLECIPLADDCAKDTDKIRSPSRIIIQETTMWVADAEHGWILAYATENFQIKTIIRPNAPDRDKSGLAKSLDMGMGPDGRLRVLDRESGCLLTYDPSGQFLSSITDPCFVGTLGPAVGRDGTVYLVDRDGAKLFLLPEGASTSKAVPITPPLSPQSIVAAANGSLFMGADNGAIHVFDPRGNALGSTTIPEFTGPVRDLAVDAQGRIYARAVRGIAVLSTQDKFSTLPAYYFSKTLDSGVRDCQWHRLDLKAHTPPGTVLEVFFYADNSRELKVRIDDILSDPQKTIQAKVEFLDAFLPWKGPEIDPGDMLFRGKTGRYLWLKLVLSTYDEHQRPEVAAMKIYYPRNTYLRYLPGIYRRDPSSREFLDRFLSIFESIFHDLEADITQVFKYFDPETTPLPFLKWLASWLNLALEDDWPEKRKRQLIRQAYGLYKLKGTLTGMVRLIHIVSGQTPMVIEHYRMNRPMALGGAGRLGIDSWIQQAPVRGFRLGEHAIVGRAPLVGGVSTPEAAFQSRAYGFTVIVALSPEAFARQEKTLIRAIDAAKPAHTFYDLRVVREARLGMDAYIGSTFKLTEHRPIRIDAAAVLGTGLIAIDKGEPGGKVERRSKVGIDTRIF